MAITSALVAWQNIPFYLERHPIRGRRLSSSRNTVPQFASERRPILLALIRKLRVVP